MAHAEIARIAATALKLVFIIFLVDPREFMSAA
jgi:hypothetical protein